jgi:hypothetical protein
VVPPAAPAVGGPNVGAAQVDHDKASGSDHDAFVGENDHLRKAIETLPAHAP